MTVPLARPTTKTVVILGAAYAGRRVAQVLSQTLPSDWKLVVIDRNTHFNHVYVFPRYTVIPHHAPKAFVPYSQGFQPMPGEMISSGSSQLSTTPLSPPSDTATKETDAASVEWCKKRVWIHGNITRLTPRSVSFKRLSNLGVGTDPQSISSSFLSSSIRAPSSHLSSSVEGEGGQSQSEEETVEFDYCLYALGATLPSPVDTGAKTEEMRIDGEDLPLGCKKRGVAFMQERAEMLRKAERIIAVGGGALGIQLATDLKSVYPDKDVTLIHSRTRLLPIYPIEMHEGVLEHLKALGITVILGERVLSWPANPDTLDGKPKTLQTSSGRTLVADLVLPCTGQRPQTLLMAQMSPSSISTTTGRIKVLKTMQVDNTDDVGERDEDLTHIFVSGDCAQTGSIQAGHTAYHQGEAAAHNIVRLIMGAEEGKKVELKEYVVTKPAIKVTLSLTKGILSNAEGTKVVDGTPEDLHAPVIWESHCVGDLSYEE